LAANTLAANASAAAVEAAIAFPRASARRGLPRRLPRALAACSASLVRWEIISRSCCATAARMWIVSLLGGLSTATNATPLSMSAAMNARLRDRRSSLAMQSLALCRRHVIIRQIQDSGVSSLRGVARALTARGVKTARGGQWNAAQVSDVINRPFAAAA